MKEVRWHIEKAEHYAERAADSSSVDSKAILLKQADTHARIAQAIAAVMTQEDYRRVR